MKLRSAIIASLSAVALLAAALTPCPVQPEASDRNAQRVDMLTAAAHHHASADPATEASAEVMGPESEHSEVAYLIAPCPCGCDKRSGSNLISKRLGPILMPEIDSMPISEPPPGETPLLQTVPAYAVFSSDLIPIPS